MRLLVALGLLLLLAQPVRAGIIDDIKAKIGDRQSVIQKLEQEIKQYQGDLTKTQAEKSTLTNEIKKIDLTDKQLSTELKVTDTKISATSLTIEKLGHEIKTKEEEISSHQQGLGEALRELANADQFSLLETLLTYPETSELWNTLASLDQFQSSVENRIEDLGSAKKDLAQKQELTIEEKNKLASLKGKLADEKKIVVQNKQTKNTLLKQTASKETEYQQLLADRLRKKRAVEDEISSLESQMKTIVNPSSLPASGSGVLKWPLAKVIITQYFGNTAFASANPQVYNGNGHNGVDFGTPVGSEIFSARTGKVMGTGDTDLTCPGASYGKWVLVQHDNGLSSLYAHLSLIKVSAGQPVNTGDLVGYSGNTGYSTGPHLHFTVYASEAVKISTLQSKVAGCGVYTLPISSPSGYLNPLSYL